VFPFFALQKKFEGIGGSPPFRIMKIERKEILILLICLLVGFSLRYYTFDRRSLWMDEIHTFNDSRDDLKGQINFYKENPSFLHPPLFFILTHQFYPFAKPERDLRIIPMISGTLSIPAIYFLARLFSPSIALFCTVCLTFMVYHVSLSQDGRSYSLLMLIGMVGLYFFIKHLETFRKRHLAWAAFFLSLLFYTSYSSILFIGLSQILWLYQFKGEKQRPALSSFLTLNGFILLFCLPWIIFAAFNYKGQGIMDPSHMEGAGSFWYILSGIFHDWVPHAPIMIVSALLLILFPIFSRHRRNASILLSLFFLPIGVMYLFCKLFHITHFVTSRYFIDFLPTFLITLFLSAEAIEFRFEGLRKLLRLRLLFTILFIASNLTILPLYYRYEKEDKRGLVNYLKNHLREGDKIIVSSRSDIPGILHYFGIHPKGRHHRISIFRDKESEEYRTAFFYRNTPVVIINPQNCCAQFMKEGNRLWIVVRKWAAKEYQEKESPFVLKGYFDGSFLNYIRFPTDASIYLFLWDPSSPDEKGIDVPIK
jgi:hypothetical protein